jgi:hypothetical protein
MLTTRYSAAVACAALVASLLATGGVCVIAQERESIRPDLSGHWQLNREISENAETKLERMQSSQGGGHGPGRHGGVLGRLFGGGDHAQMEEARGLLLNAPASFTLRQDGDRLVLTESDGRVRTFTTNGRKMKVNGRDVQTNWGKHRLVSEISLDGPKITETYERSTNAAQLIVTTKMDMRGHDVTVCRVYDAGSRE